MARQKAVVLVSIWKDRNIKTATKVKTNKHMFEFFSPSGSRTILVYRNYTDTKHRAASLRQQSFLSCMHV